MESFNRYLTQLKELDVNLYLDNNSKDTLDDLQEIVYEEANPVIEAMSQPLQPQFNTAKIYYPISWGEFPPIGVRYETNSPITPADLFDSISAFYKQELKPDNTAAYMATGGYRHLNDPYYQRKGIIIKDVVKGDQIDELIPYEDGYLLKLE